MPGKRRNRSRGSPNGNTRRRFLLKVGAGGVIVGSLGVGYVSTDAFSSVTGSRDANVSVASGGSGIVGIVGQGPVQKNSRDPMVDITNNGPAAYTFTVALQTCSDGTLYDNDGESGCSVTFSLGSGNTQRVDIEASATGTLPYDISVSDPTFSFSATETVESQAGNVQTAVTVKDPDKDNEFTANTDPQNNWDVKQVDVRDNDGDDDLDRVEFEVTEDSSGNIVGSKTVSNIPGDRYAPSGSGDETIQPDDASYTISVGQSYTLKVTGYDADGNFRSSTVEDTASGGGGGGGPP